MSVPEPKTDVSPEKETPSVTPPVESSDTHGDPKPTNVPAPKEKPPPVPSPTLQTNYGGSGQYPPFACYPYPLDYSFLADPQVSYAAAAAAMGLPYVPLNTGAVYPPGLGSVYGSASALYGNGPGYPVNPSLGLAGHPPYPAHASGPGPNPKNSDHRSNNNPRTITPEEIALLVPGHTFITHMPWPSNIPTLTCKRDFKAWNRALVGHVRVRAMYGHIAPLSGTMPGMSTLDEDGEIPTVAPILQESVDNVLGSATKAERLYERMWWDVNRFVSGMILGTISEEVRKLLPEKLACVSGGRAEPGRKDGADQTGTAKQDEPKTTARDLYAFIVKLFGALDFESGYEAHLRAKMLKCIRSECVEMYVGSWRKALDVIWTNGGEYVVDVRVLLCDFLDGLPIPSRKNMFPRSPPITMTPRQYQEFLSGAGGYDAEEWHVLMGYAYLCAKTRQELKDVKSDDKQRLYEVLDEALRIMKMSRLFALGKKVKAKLGEPIAVTDPSAANVESGSDDADSESSASEEEGFFDTVS